MSSPSPGSHRLSLERLAALRRSGLLDSAPEDDFDRLARLAGRLLGVPVVLVSLVDEERQFFKSHVGLPEPLASERQTPLAHSFCQYVVDAQAPYVVEDARLDPVVSGSAATLELGVIAYAGVPLTTSDGQTLGSFCAIDSKPRRWTDEEVSVLRDLADSVVTEIELRLAAAEADHRARQITALLESTSEGVYGIDANGLCTFVNPAGAAMLGYKQGEVLGQNMHELTHHTRPDGSPYPHSECPILLASVTGKGCRVEDDVLWRKGGTPFPAEYASSALVEDGTLVGAVVTFRDISQRKAAETELRGRAEREALLNRIGETLRLTVDPDEIQARAVQALGEALGADRCFLVSYELARDAARVERDWHRDDLASLAGMYRVSELGLNPEEMFRTGGGTRVIGDVSAEGLFPPDTERKLGQMGVRAGLGVALYEEGRLVGSLNVVMAQVSRQWTADEVSLVQAVATLTRTAREEARARMRERRIAERLQEALRPPPPGDDLPGLDVEAYYRAALAEASVGGDFYDVFALDDDRVALVVADVSGKGLQAAAQVATVRHMLRALLYEGHSPSDAVTRLNAMLSDYHLLAGFVTLAVAVYDHTARAITYASCGHEPGLLLRAGSGVLKELQPTGAVLGVMPGEAFGQRTVPLAPGDVFTFFTDGVTEAGRSREQMLGVDGLGSLLCRSVPDAASTAAAQIMARLVREVDTFAGPSGIRDDVCLLVACVK
jgi:PAS domain S-box-containing protein